MANVVVMGILDTKGSEVKFLAEKVKEAGANACILELTPGGEVGWADIGVNEILKPFGHSTDDLQKVDRHQAAAWIAEGAKAKVKELYDAGQLQGMVSFGGSMGGSIASEVMRSMPLGVPKFCITTMTSGDVRQYVGTKDMVMMYPIAEAGLNSLTKQIITNAAYGIAGMASAPRLETEGTKTLLGCMMFGVTTPCVLRASGNMEAAGYDVIINHAIGTGGRSMEEMIDDGFVKGILDITTDEILNELTDGVLSAGPERLTAAARNGIPQVICPGGLDLINYNEPASVPASKMKEVEEGKRTIYYHNPNVTCASSTPEEAAMVARDMAGKLNKTNGPTCICVPMRGWGACDMAGIDKDLGWAGPDPAPDWIGDPEKPEWSLRSEAFVKALKEDLDLDNEKIEVLVTDYHMNEPDFADLLSTVLKDMLDGTWTKGKDYGPKVVAL